MLRFEPLEEPEETIFLTLENVDQFHEDILKPQQIRGYKRLDDLLGALGRPENALYYEQGCDLVKVAAYYWHGISTSHGYIDGNKRTGFVSANNFLLMNGIRFEASDISLGPLILMLFDHDLFELDALDDILRRHCNWA